MKTQREIQAVHMLLYSAAGDALGYIVEGQRNCGHISGFRKFTAVKGHRFNRYEVSVLPGDYTDDTEYTLAAASSLRSTVSADPRIFEAHLAYYARHGTTGGLSMKKMGQRINSRKGSSFYDDPGKLFYAKTKSLPLAYHEQKGGGVLMRISPFAAAMANAEDRTRSVYENGILTHGSTEALLSAAFHCELLKRNLENPGTPLKGTLEAMLGMDFGVLRPSGELMDKWCMAYRDKTGNEFWDAADDAVMKIGSLIQEILLLPEHEYEAFIRNRLRQQTSIEILGSAIVFALGAAESIDAKLIDAVNLGKELRLDTDTVCAILGQIEGSRHTGEALSSLEQGVQDRLYIQKVGSYLAGGLESGVCVGLQEGWKERMHESAGLWHPIYGDAEITAENQVGGFIVRRLRFPKGKTMAIKTSLGKSGKDDDS